ncbi:eukaryotic translation initiation factor 4E-binding protein 1-like [Gouania willdenowi]|uniref:Eukaryotic translation initiation factor 4E binding protein 1 n=1 Tax=Gouania willdenowi TaxID=441366 RepID=A0A8C5EEM1_GOUWI|nr:eukaryotic translation initiation factor 4E-binding protein 1 [Gouania willdenowi]
MSAGNQSSTRSRDIPAVRRVAVHDAAHMPQDYSSTPGGTVFSTTPGGTRIIYDRKFLLQCRTSPLAQTPPNLPDIPGVTRPLKPESPRDLNQELSRNNLEHGVHGVHVEESAGEDAQFEMDI